MSWDQSLLMNIDWTMVITNNSSQDQYDPGFFNFLQKNQIRRNNFPIFVSLVSRQAFLNYAMTTMTVMTQISSV